MKSPLHPKDQEFAGIPGYLARPPQKKRKPSWTSRILGSMVEKDDGSWVKAQLERGHGGIQEGVEAYLEARRYPYFRLPDLLMYAISPACDKLPVHWKKHIADYITDWPDLLIARVTPGIPYPVLLALELKSAAGKQSQGQKIVGALVACRVARSVPEAVDIVEEFYAWNP